MKYGMDSQLSKIVQKLSVIVHSISNDFFVNLAIWRITSYIYFNLFSVLGNRYVMSHSLSTTNLIFL